MTTLLRLAWLGLIFACFILPFLESASSQAITKYPDTRKTPEGYYMNEDKCFCVGLGGTCIGDCGRTFRSAELTTRDSFLYGRFEARLLPSIDVDGTVATFFLYKNDSDKVKGAAWQEIDFEVHGMGPHGADPIQTNMITGDFVNRQFAEVFLPAPGAARTVEAQREEVKTSFHHFAMEWTPDYIAWYFDGRRVRYEVPCNAANPPSDAPEQCSPQPESLNSPMNLRISLWPLDPTPFWAENWAGIFDPSKTQFPLIVYFDYVKTYKYNPDTRGFEFHWIDDFTSLDDTRWEFGEHTFDVNFATFSRENAVIVKDTAAKQEASKDLSAAAAAGVPVKKDRSYLAIVMQPEKTVVASPPLPRDAEPSFDRFAIPELERVVEGWNPPAQTFIQPALDCDTLADAKADGGILEKGILYTGGLMSFSRVVDEQGEAEKKLLDLSGQYLPFVDSADTATKVCAAMCYEAYSQKAAGCRSFSLAPTPQGADNRGGRTCYGFTAPRRRANEVLYSSGTLCRGLDPPALEAESTAPAATVGPTPAVDTTASAGPATTPGADPFSETPTFPESTAAATQPPSETSPGIAETTAAPTLAPTAPPLDSTEAPLQFPYARLSLRILGMSMRAIQTAEKAERLVDSIARSLEVPRDFIEIESVRDGSIIVDFAVKPSAKLQASSPLYSKEALTDQWSLAVRDATSPISLDFLIDPSWEPVAGPPQPEGNFRPEGAASTASGSDVSRDSGIAPDGSAFGRDAEDSDSPYPATLPPGTNSGTTKKPTQKDASTSRPSSERVTATDSNSKPRQRESGVTTRSRERLSSSDASENNEAWVYALIIILALLFIGVLAGWILVVRRQREAAKKRAAKASSMKGAGVEASVASPGAYAVHNALSNKSQQGPV